MWAMAITLSVGTVLGMPIATHAQGSGANTTTRVEGSTATLSMIEANGIRMRVAEEGEGPMVLLLHGFPQLWYAWRHQLPALAEAGYRAVAPDLRGFGGTDQPPNLEDYDSLDLCSDVVSLMDALGEKTAVLVGHDWGAAVAWSCALQEPERFTGLVTMSVPWGPRASSPPLPRMREQAGDNFNYMLFFQEPGVAEAELESRTRELFSKMFVTPGAPRETPTVTDPLAAAGGFVDRIGMPNEQSAWITQADIDYYVSAFEQTGFAGGLNYYRNLDRNWELTAHTAGRRIEIPTLFMAGDREFLIAGRSKENLETSMRPLAPQIQVEILAGNIGHWLLEQRPDLVNKHLIDFLQSLEATTTVARVETLAELPASTGGMVVDRKGNVYVADIGPAPEREGTTLYKITPEGAVNVFATGFLGATGNAIDSKGNLYQSNLRQHSISKVTPSGEVSTFVPMGGVIAPVGIVVDPQDNLYVANCGSGSIQKVTADGQSTQYAASELFRCPNGITLDPNGNIYVANFRDGNVLKVTSDGHVSLFATLPGGNNGHIAYSHGKLYVVARQAHQVYTLSMEGDLELFAGTGERGLTDGPALEASFSLPNDIALSPTGDTLYVNQVAPINGTDNHPSLVRMIILGDEK